MPRYRRSMVAVVWWWHSSSVAVLKYHLHMFASFLLSVRERNMLLTYSSLSLNLGCLAFLCTLLLFAVKRTVGKSELDQ